MHTLKQLEAQRAGAQRLQPVEPAGKSEDEEMLEQMNIFAAAVKVLEEDEREVRANPRDPRNMWYNWMNAATADMRAKHVDDEDEREIKEVFEVPVDQLTYEEEDD